MAITSLWKLTGDATPNNFDGPAAGWNIGTGTTFANTGIRFGGDGAVYAVAGNKGTLIAWSGTGKNAKPSWATGPGFIETSSTGLAFEAIAAASISRAICEDGLEFSCGIQFSINSAYAIGTTPPDAPTPISIHCGTGASEPTTGHFRAYSHNLAPGWAPNLTFPQGIFTGTGRLIYGANGGGNATPQGAIDFDKWYKFRARVRSATVDGALTGECQYWINDMLVATFDGVDTYYTDPTKLVTWCGLLNAYTAAITGVRVRYCGPLEVRRVPQADIQSAAVPDWTPNTTSGRDLRRFWPVCWNGGGSPSLMTGAATTPYLGELNSTGGVNPSRYIRIINGTAGNGFSSKFPAIWGGSVADSPFGSKGHTWINFLDLCCKNLGIISAIVYAADNVTPIITCTIDGNANTFTINGTQVATGLAASSRWQVAIQLSAGSAVVMLHNITTAAIDANTIKAFQSAVTYSGGAIGQSEISGAFSAPGYMGHGAISVHSKLSVACVDSYSSAQAFMGAPMSTTYAMPNMQCNSNHFGSAFNQLADLEAIPNGYDCVPYEAGLGVGGIPGITIGLNLGRSGYKLSELETFAWPAISIVSGLRWILLCGDVNDTTATTTDDLMIAQANTLADRKTRFAQYILARQGELILLNGINLQNIGAVMADGVDANNVRRRITPAAVADIILSRLAALKDRTGSLRVADISSRQSDAVAFISADGIHPTNTITLAFYAHQYWDQCKNRTGFNSDGSIAPASSGSNKLRNRNI